MKKIYSKLTKERDLIFQIETAIYEDQEGNRKVIKRPLNENAADHIKKLYDNYQHFSNNKIDVLLPCKMDGDSVVFPYIAGNSLYDQILRAAEENNRDVVLKIFYTYMDVVKMLYPETHPFKKTEEFVKIFGDIDCFPASMACQKIDIDLTFDNIVDTEAGMQILDYEWIFDFDIPLKFPIYRAIYALYMKNAKDMNNVVSDDELYKIAGISREERTYFLKMNARFMEYVEGYENSYTQLLDAYKQPAQREGSLLDYAQVYWSNNGVFSEKRIKNYDVALNENIELVVNLEEFEGADCIRIDPSNWASMIQVLKFEVETEAEVYNLSQDDYMVNTWGISDRYWIFESEDPQIIIPLPKEKKWKNIKFEYRIEFAGLENMKLLFSTAHSYCQREIKKWQDKAREKQELAEGQARLLNECSHTISSYEEIIQLQKDKLAYIESTKAYQGLLKSKVDSIHLWDKLKEEM